MIAKTKKAKVAKQEKVERATSSGVFDNNVMFAGNVRNVECEIPNTELTAVISPRRMTICGVECCAVVSLTHKAMFELYDWLTENYIKRIDRTKIPEPRKDEKVLTWPNDNELYRWDD